MNELKGPAIKIFFNTIASITGAQTAEQADSTAQLARGYLVGIRLLEIINDSQYSAMSNLLKAAVDAVKQRIKRTASGVTSTESGHGQALLHNHSITIIAIGVNKGGAGNGNE